MQRYAPGDGSSADGRDDSSAERYCNDRDSDQTIAAVGVSQEAEGQQRARRPQLAQAPLPRSKLRGARNTALTESIAGRLNAQFNAIPRGDLD